MASYTQSKASGGSGEPVDPMLRNFDKSNSSPGLICSFIHATRNGALVPKWLIGISDASFHSELRLGYAGLPSYNTILAPCSIAPCRKFHIIHPVVVYQKKFSPACTSLWKARY